MISTERPFVKDTNSKMEQDLYDKLHQLYYRPDFAGSLGGIQRLLREARKEIPTLTQKQVEAFLTTQESYTLYKLPRRKFRRSRISPLICCLLDLADLGDLAPENDGYRYLLGIIDVFSKRVWLCPLVSKSGPTVLKALKLLLDTIPTPDSFETDKGGEFMAASVIKLMQDKGITYFQSQNDDIKCAVIERFWRTLKSRISIYLRQNNTKRYIDDLQLILSSYNNSYHRSIKTSPSLVTRENEEEVFHTLFPGPKPNLETGLKYKYKVGDKVRMTFPPDPMRKGFKQQNTEEIFTISELVKADPPRYKVKDIMNEQLIGTFYAQELVLTTLAPGQEPQMIVDKILKRRTRNKVKEVYVKFRGYPNSANVWMKEADITNV